MTKGLDKILYHTRLVDEGCGSRLIRALGESTPAASTIPARPSSFHLDSGKGSRR
jgi:hypothetical protein